MIADDAEQHATIVTHVESITPLLAATFGAIPLVYVDYPDGLDKAAVFHNHLDHGPATITTVDVQTSSGLHRFVALSAHNVSWLVRGKFAVELQSWSPTANDPLRAAFARITLEPAGTAGRVEATKAALLLRERLLALKLDAIALLDGGTGYALWIPLAGGPNYADVNAWLHGFVAEAIATAPELMTTEYLRANRGDRVYVGTHSNHPGMSSVLPYIARGNPHLPIALPLHWNDVGRVWNGDVTASSFAAWLQEYGDMFAACYVTLRGQMLPVMPKEASTIQIMPEQAGDGHAPDGILSAALAVLADGKARTPQEILTEGIAMGVFAPSLTRKHLYTDLYEYVMRTLGVGKKPEILHDEAQKTFRINRPLDVWPDVELPPLPRWLDEATIAKHAANLRAAATGDDPTAFEVAVCDAFGDLGFTATHIGGHGTPDGTLDAQLGSAGYRVILECKTAKPGGIVNNPRPAEPASFFETYHAHKAILIGPAFSDEASLKSELMTHGVALWTVEDLATVLQAQIGPLELLPLLQPGSARDACASVLWERDHGRRKRIAAISERILRVGWRAQAMFASKIAPNETPVLTRDTLLLLVDGELVSEGMTIGAAPEEYGAAFEMLIARRALQPFGDTGDAYVVAQPITGFEMKHA